MPGSTVDELHELGSGLIESLGSLVIGNRGGEPIPVREDDAGLEGVGGLR